MMKAGEVCFPGFIYLNALRGRRFFFAGPKKNQKRPWGSSLAACVSRRNHPIRAGRLHFSR